MTPAEKAVIDAAVKWASEYQDWIIVDGCRPLLRAVARLLLEREAKARKGARP